MLRRACYRQLPVYTRYFGRSQQFPVYTRFLGSSSYVLQQTNVHRDPVEDPFACEDKFRSIEWDEYNRMANDSTFLSGYTKRSLLLTKNKKLERDIQTVFAFAAFLSFALGVGYVYDAIWKQNREKSRVTSLNQEKTFFRRISLDPFTIDEIPNAISTGNSLQCNVQLISCKELPFKHFLRISVEEANAKYYESNTVQNMFIPAVELSQAYTIESQAKESEFSFQSITELKMRLENSIVDRENNLLYIPNDTKTYALKKSTTVAYKLYTANSSGFRDYQSWYYSILVPTITFASISSLITYFVTRQCWRKACRNLNFIPKAIHSPWRQGLLFGGRVALISTFFNSLFSFGAIYLSYKTRSFCFEDEEITSDALDTGNQWIQVPTLAIIYTACFMLLSSWFVIPAGAITGRIATGKIYQEMLRLLPRSTVAVRKFTKPV